MARRGALKRSQVLDLMKNKLAEATASGATGVPLDDGVLEATQVHDPMNMLHDIETPPAKKPRYSPKRKKDQVVEIEMPNMPAEVDPNGQQGTRKVQVLARSTNQLWMSVDHVEWLLKLHGERTCLRRGSPRVDVARSGGRNCHCRGAVHSERLADAMGVRAEVVAGSLRGWQARWTDIHVRCG